MRINPGMTGATLCLAATLLVANVAQAQVPSTPAPAPEKAPAPSTAPAQPAAGPDALFIRWDKDRNKALSLDEFKAGWQELQAAAALRQLHETFVARDANKSGRLEAAEYANLELVKKAGPSAPPMSAFDADKNQALDFKEYLDMVNAMAKNKH